MRNLTAAILAGGFGTRLRPVVGDRPKALAEIHGKPFLNYLLDQLAEFRIRRVVICTGYLGEQVWMTYGDIRGKMRLIYSQEDSPLGTAGALRLALPKLDSDPMLVMNGDAFCAIDLEHFYAWHQGHGSRVTMALVKVDDAARYGRVRIDANGAVVEFAEKTGDSTPAWINAGIYIIDRSVIGALKPGQTVSLEREVFPAWVGKGLYGYSCEGRFLDIGTPQSYADAKRFFADEARP